MPSLIKLSFYFFLPYVNIFIQAQSIFGNNVATLRRNTSPYKGYSGYVLAKDSLKVVYYYDQSIAVVEIGQNKQLINCEIIEVYEKNETANALEAVSKAVREPFEIDFEKMTKLMKQCQYLKIPPRSKFFKSVDPDSEKKKTENEPANPLTLLNGILPGTKWCGTGDIADTYYDLGVEFKLDKCCRTHDLCPSKIRAHTTRYNITNNSIYTKSHCSCDKQLRSCLKSTKNPTADLMGEFYFNILRVPCLHDTDNGKKFKLPQQY